MQERERESFIMEEIHLCADENGPVKRGTLICRRLGTMAGDKSLSRHRDGPLCPGEGLALAAHTPDRALGAGWAFPGGRGRSEY